MHVVEMEAQLAADDRGVLRDELCQALAEDRGAARRRIDAGLAPDDFQATQAWHDACVAADRVVRGFWRNAHRKMSGG